jgi:serine/threonine-protein kinase RsbT
MPGTRTKTLSVHTRQDVALVRQSVRNIAQEIGFTLIDQTRIITAASELARNTLIYGGGGLVECEVISSQEREGLRLTFSDHGPGIEDIRLAMKDGWSSRGGLGLGLPGSKRLMDQFEIHSKPGAGTRVTIVLWRRPRKHEGLIQS